VRWVDDSGYQTSGYSRELYLVWHEDAPDSNVTELQLPLAVSSPGHLRVSRCDESPA